MKKIFIGILLILGLLLIFLILNFRKGLYPKKANRKIRDGEFDFIVDVRTDEEWLEGHYIPKRDDLILYHIGMEKLVNELPRIIKDKEARILFQCKKGIRSKAAASIAESLGYKNIDFLIGNYTDLN